MAAAESATDWSGPAWTVRSAVRGFLRERSLRGPLCVALSGGPDSLALAAACCAESREVTALVVDHGLQDGSAEVAERAARAAEGMGARAVVERVSVAVDGSGPEAAARTARYAALDRLRQGRPVLLGHTLDDQAETVLLGLARGSGARSLRGMAPWTGPWGRPLLGVRAADTRSACRLLDLRPWDDPHNTDPAYTRVRLRREVLPLLDEVLGGGVAESLSRTAGLLRADDDELGRIASAVPVSTGPLELSLVDALPGPVLDRVLRRWLAAHGVATPGFAQTRAVAALVTTYTGQGAVAVSGRGDERGARSRLVVLREHGKLVTAHEPTGERGRV